MKATIEDYTAKTFVPFTLTLQFDNIDEARDLWHRLNASISAVMRNSGDESCTFPNTWDSDILMFSPLDEHMVSHGYKKGSG